MKSSYNPSVKISQIKNLVFEGGGVKGIAYLGAFKKLISNGLDFTKVQRIAGTSVGAITALLLSIGCTPEELEKNILEMEFRNFLDENNTNVRDALLNIKDRYQEGDYTLLLLEALDPNLAIGSSRISLSQGLFDGKEIRQWFEAKIFEKTGIQNLTFEELHKLPEQDPKKFKDVKDLYVVGVNVNTGLAQTFSYEDTPNVVIADAVRISMSIPFVFKTHKVHCKINGERKVDPAFENSCFIDGGITENYPLNLFDHTRYLPEELRIQLEIVLGLPGKISNPTTLGFRLVNTEEKAFYEGRCEAPIKTMQNPLTKSVTNNLAVKSLSALNHKMNSDHIRFNEQSRSVYIDNCGIGTLDFNLNNDQKKLLCQSGAEATNNYFNWPEVNARQSNNYQQISALDQKTLIDQDHCVVGFFSKKHKKENNFFTSFFGKSKKTNEEFIIVVEGMDESGKAIFKCYGLYVSEHNTELASILKSSIKANSIYDKREVLLENRIFPQSNVSIIDRWPITKKHADALATLIEDEEALGILNFGRNNYPTNFNEKEIARQKRYDWCDEKLRQLNNVITDSPFKNTNNFCEQFKTKPNQLRTDALQHTIEIGKNKIEEQSASVGRSTIYSAIN